MTGKLFKSPDVLVLPADAALKLVHQGTGKSRVLSREHARLWLEWPAESALRALDPRLVPDGFLVFKAEVPEALVPSALDAVVVSPRQPYAKWYSETPDLYVLFNTQLMEHNNPLLVLGPYGSLCWRGILAGRTVADIRAEALRVFGKDEVLEFIARLASLGFVAGSSDISAWVDAPATLRKEFCAPAVQFQLTKAATPWYCLWELLTQCNLRCRQCYLPDFDYAGPSAQQALSVADQIARAGIFYTSIIGGEPLLRNDLEDVIRHLRANGVFVKVISNGWRLSVDRGRQLRDCGLNQIEISFDGLTSTTHESSRGVGSFARAIAGVRSAQRAGLMRIGIVITVHHGNLEELSRLPHFMAGLDVSECYISLFRKTGLNGAASNMEALDAAGVENLRNFARCFNEEHATLHCSLLPACTCGRTSIVIGAHGDVRPCSFLYTSVGNAFETSLIDLWRISDAPAPDFCRASAHSLVRMSLSGRVQ